MLTNINNIDKTKFFDEIEADHGPDVRREWESVDKGYGSYDIHGLGVAKRDVTGVVERLICSSAVEDVFHINRTKIMIKFRDHSALDRNRAALTYAIAFTSC